jgi:hypothetical protein
MYQMYASIAPRPEDWPRLLLKLGEAMANDFAPWSSLGSAPVLSSMVIPFLDGK